MILPIDIQKIIIEYIYNCYCILYNNSDNICIMDNCNNNICDKCIYICLDCNNKYCRNCISKCSYCNNNICYYCTIDNSCIICYNYYCNRYLI